MLKKQFPCNSSLIKLILLILSNYIPWSDQLVRLT